jgi:hypothetical protein
MANDGRTYPRAGGTAEFRASTRLALNLRDHMTCQNCLRDLTGATADEITLDHLVTACEYHKMSQDEQDAFGSRNDPRNVITVCRSCNLARNNKTWDAFYSPEAQLRILAQVVAPLNRALALSYLRGKEA